MQVKSNTSYLNSSDILSNPRTNQTRDSGSAFADRLNSARKGVEGAQKSPAFDAPPLRPDSSISQSSGSGGSVTLDFFSFGENDAIALPKGTSRLEFNVYRPDGLDIDGRTIPFTVKSTGERLDAITSAKYQKILLDVAKQRIKIYNDGKADGQTDDQILAALHHYDNNLPASYRDMVGKSSLVGTNTRYDMPTYEELNQVASR